MSTLGPGDFGTRTMRWYGALLFLLGYLLITNTAFAADATLYLSPITGIYTNGETATVSVVAASGGLPINAIEGKLEYNPKEIELISVDPAESVIVSWTVPPSFDNTIGEVTFGGLLATSTVLDRGLVLKFTFKAVRNGDMSIRFASGAAMLAADGTGGNILSALKGGVYTISPRDETPDTPPDGATPSVSGGEVLGAATDTPPEITSPTHPDQTAWYAQATSTLEWNTLPDVVGIKLALTSKSTGEGSVSYGPTVSEKTIPHIEDGVYYFHLTRIFSDGHNETEHYRLAIDTQDPRGLSVSEKPRSSATIPDAVFEVNATDTLSGVDHYEFSVDGGPAQSWTDDGTHEYHAPRSSVGDHTLTVSAVDRAGNRSTTQIKYSVEYLATPSIAKKDDSYTEGTPITLSVSGVPNASVAISIAREGGSPVKENIALDTSGKAEFTSTLILSPGDYEVWAVASDASGATSKEGEHITIVANASLLGIIKRHPFIPVAAILLVLMFGGLAWYWKRMRQTDTIDEEFFEDETPPQHVSAPSPSIPIQRTVARGAVVLGKLHGQPVIPATRL